MQNVLIIDDNLNYAMNLMNFINKNNENVKICGVINDSEEAIKELNSNRKIDIIILDSKYSSKKIMNSIRNKQTYDGSIIIISDENKSIKELNNNNMISSVIHRNAVRQEIIKELNYVFDKKEHIKKEIDYRKKIIRELNFLGYDMAYKGTKYLIDAIEYIILNNNKDVSNLERDVYSKIANKYEDSIHNIKCNISRANNSMYCECEIEKLKKYFYLDKDSKPKTKMIINIITNKII